MKQLLLTILFLITSIYCYGQYAYVGGAVSSRKVGGVRSVNIVPEFGYCINRHNSTSLTFAYSTFIDEDNVNHSIKVTPCYSYVIPIGELWQLDINASVGYSRFFGLKSNRLGLYLGPQIEYFIKPQWSVWCGFDAIELETEWYDGQEKSSNINFNWFSTGINLGFYYYFFIRPKKDFSTKTTEYCSAMKLY